MWALGVKRENFSGAKPHDEKVLTRTLTKRHDDRRGQKVVLHLKPEGQSQLANDATQ
jgi:hypothetical protein